jgi:hypothetical protein
MGRLQKVSVAAALFMAAMTHAMALTAVVEVNENDWYKYEKPTRYAGASFSRFYAPLPVFFEGWKSSPREDIVDWVWDFGDGAAPFHGFNAAHVYEKPGTYTATLTVVTREGQTASTTYTIEALQATGKTYYVDSVIGDDANPGTSPDAPWKTATKAFLGLNDKRYNPGERILFHRGQTFDFEAGLVRPGGGMAGYGYYFGPYGEGAKPIIKHVGTSTAEMFKIGGNFMAFWGLMDLSFDCKSAEGAVSSFFINTACIANIFFLRCDIYNHFQAIGMNGDDQTRQITNVYIIGCNIHDSIGTDAMHLYTKASRYANIDSTFDMCDDHVGYHSYLDKAIFSGNTYTRWAFGRLAIRSCGVSAMNHPTNNVHIINNKFLGWIDPKIDTWAHTGKGTRYNLCAVELGPNKGLDQAMEYGLIENNVFSDVEKFVEIGDWEHVIVRNNSFSTQSTATGNMRFQIGHPYEHRPVKDIQFYDNTIVSNENRAGTAPIFALNWYCGPAYAERSVHEDIYIARNRVTLLNGDARLITVGTTDSKQIAELTSNGNTVYNATQTQRIFQCGGTYNAPQATYNLAEWQLLTGNDRATLILPLNSQLPLPGIATSPAQAEMTPIPVSYEGALCVNGSGLKEVRLWVKKDGDPWTNTGMTLPSAKGTFLFTNVSGNGLYYFATQAVDNSGGVSPAPIDMGHSTTTYQELGGADTTAPWPATAAAPMFANAGPIPVHYNAASDMGGSGLKAVHLWVRKDDGAWADSGLSAPADEGDFSYNGMTGDGAYHFATRSEDNAGNFSPEPTGTGDATTVLDTLAPTAGTLNAPGLVKDAAPVSVTYAGAGDGGSGLKSVALWVRKDAGAWTQTDQTLATDSGSFGYTPSGSGTYYFDLVATDNAGLSSPEPSGDGQGHIVYDTDPPVTGAISAPPTTDRLPISVQYSGAQDALSGLKAVRLWVKKGAAGAWTPTTFSSAASADTFEYDGATENGTYYFALEAEDNMGNTTGQPSDAAAVATNYGHVLTAGTATAPSTATASPIVVSYSGAYDSNDNGISFVYLWYKKGAAGAWTDSGLSATTQSGSFNFTPSTNETYFFALQAQNKAGAKSAVPSGAGDCSTLYDTTPPTGGTVSAPYMTKTVPYTINYSGVTDSGSGLQTVSLWIRKYPAAWYDTGLKQTGGSGSFSFGPTSGSGTYCIALVSQDNAGLTSAAPTGWGLYNTIYDVTVPIAGTVTAPASASTAPIAVSYSGASDAHSGLKAVHLWSKKGSTGAWADTGLSATTASGTFQFSGVTGSATYYFAVQAEDKVGNFSAVPSGSGGANTVYQSDASAGLAVSPAHATSSPITVTYSGASDVASGLKAVYLWYKKGAAGTWTDSGLSSTGGSGSFAFAASGDDTYYFATQAENNAGTRSAAPSADGQTRTVLDSTAPVCGTPAAPATSKSSPVTVTYSGASDAGSGLKSVTLWASKDAGAWAATSLSATAASGSFSYAPAQSGTYRFALVALDNAGNASATPTGEGQATTTYDVDAPKLGTLTAPATSDRSPITVTYAGIEDTVSGLKTVTLWVKKGATGTWAPTTLTSAAASGSFDYSDMSGNDTYCFALQAQDNAGNASAAPTGDGAASTQFARTMTAGTATAPQYAKTKPIRVTYSGATDSGGALKGVHLWYRKGAAGTWTDSGLFSAGASGGFDFTAVTGDDTYYFDLQAENNSGGKSSTPSGDGLARTVYDTTAPVAGTVQAPRSVNKIPFSVYYSGVTDAGSGVKQVILWVKESRSGVWTDTGLRSTTAPNGEFVIGNLSRDAKYYFFTQVEDNAGNISAAPTDAGVF